MTKFTSMGVRVALDGMDKNLILSYRPGADRTIKLWDEWTWRDRCTWVYANLTPDLWLHFVGRSIYRATCPTRASEPAPSIATAFDGNPQYLLITWPGRFVVAGATLVSLAIVGLLLWVVFRLVRWLLRKVFRRSEVPAA